MAAIAAALFAWLAIGVRSGATLDFDLGVRARVHEWSSPASTAIARGLTAAGSTIFVTSMFAIAMLVFFRSKWKRPAVTLLAVMAGALVCDLALKALFHRARPEPFFGAEPASYSFPSGHALFSLAFYGVIARTIAARAPTRMARIGIWVAAALLVAGIGLSRIYLGVHYPTDVLAGYLTAAVVIGAVSACEHEAS